MNAMEEAVLATLTPSEIERTLDPQRHPLDPPAARECEACHGKGYLHVMCDQGPEIEACDACNGKRTGTGLDDARAAILHRLTCGCTWPEFAGRPDVPSYGTQEPRPTFSPEK